MMSGMTVEAPDMRTEEGLRTLLVSAMDEEVALLENLRDVFVVQREALGKGDPSALDDGIFAATRVMRTMEEARQRRRRLMTRLVGDEVDLEELDLVLTGPVNRPVRSARDRVRVAAGRLRDEVTLLRAILRTALSDNRRYLEILLGDTTRPVTGAVYGDGGGAGGALFDRTA